jgi:predicted amidohydrolase
MNAESLAEEENGKTLKWLQQTAKDFNVAITGSVIIKENTNYYNRLFFVFPNGSYETYDKKHLFTLADEQKTYSAGKKRLIIDYKGWKICPLVCYDLRFPVWSRNTEDFDLLIYVANWPEKRTEAWDALLKARAIENMCYVAGVNRVGLDGNKHNYLGHSAVYDMLGKQISRLNYEEVFTECLQLNKEELEETRKRFAFLNDRDRFSLA